VLFDMLCNDPDSQVASKDLTTQWDLKKRLQRSREFLLLVKPFGDHILHAVPEVSVSRLDPVKFVSRLELKPRWRSYGMTEEDRAVAVSWTIE
jgi:hypothetical protein